MIVFTVNNSRSLAIGSGALSDAGFVVFFFFSSLCCFGFNVNRNTTLNPDVQVFVTWPCRLTHGF